MTKHILTKQQRESGLDTREDDHNVYLLAVDRVIAMLSNHATIKEIQNEANKYVEGKHE